MSSHLQKQLQTLAHPDSLEILTAINRGIEKESLRITADGRLAQTAHPSGLGSALTHPGITTDYSEALLEFITPVSSSIEHSLRQLEDIHSYTYQQMTGEMLWSASMPCIVSGDAGIPVAQYGSSNVAKMKTAYRYGLGHRYGRLMQAISGIHYNFSMPAAYWDYDWKNAGRPGKKQDFITAQYLGLIRNFRRYSWLLIYLFGASPAVCASFLKGRDNHHLQAFDAQAKSLFLPYATALRMGGLGYNSAAQKNLHVGYNSLDNYVETLSAAIVQPHPAYADIPAGQNGNYQQLSDSLLQIENEFYSPIRPKRVAKSGEAPLRALMRAGIEYIEVRCVDINPFTPVGLDAQQMRFMDTFLLYCLCEQSPPCDEQEQVSLADNFAAVVSGGREPGLQLNSGAGMISLKQWGTELLNAMLPIAALLDKAHGGKNYVDSLKLQLAKVEDSGLTPSARILQEMHDRKLPFFKVAMAYSEQWAAHFNARPLAPEIQAAFETQTLQSLQAQAAIEKNDTVSFEQYLRNFFLQYKTL